MRRHHGDGVQAEMAADVGAEPAADALRLADDDGGRGSWSRGGGVDAIHGAEVEADLAAGAGVGDHGQEPGGVDARGGVHAVSRGLARAQRKHRGTTAAQAEGTEDALAIVRLCGLRDLSVETGALKTSPG